MFSFSTSQQLPKKLSPSDSDPFLLQILMNRFCRRSKNVFFHFHSSYSLIEAQLATTALVCLMMESINEIKSIFDCVGVLWVCVECVQAWVQMWVFVCLEVLVLFGV